MSWNPRYVAYARAHGNTPEHQSALDRQRYPGGRMAGFLVWTSGQWREWHADTGRGPLPLTAADHAAFDAWLLAQTDTRSDPTPSGSNQRRRVTTEQGEG